MVSLNPHIHRDRAVAFASSVRDDRHYLTEVSFAGSSMHSRPVVKRSFAREVAKNSQLDSPIEISMK